MPLATITGTYRLGTDVDFGFTGKGTAYANFRAAASISKKLDNGNYETLAEHWANFKIFGADAERFQESLSKGAQFEVWGKPRTETWEDKNTGEKRSKDVIFIDGFRAIQKAGDSQSIAQASAASTDPWGSAPAGSGSFGNSSDEPAF